MVVFPATTIETQLRVILSASESSRHEAPPRLAPSTSVLSHSSVFLCTFLSASFALHSSNHCASSLSMHSTMESTVACRTSSSFLGLSLQ